MNKLDACSVVSMGSDGQIRFWNIHEGTLHWEIEGVNDAEEGIFCASVNEENTLLITTDSRGFIALWDISQCCISKQDDYEMPLQIEWRAHLQSIVCMDMIEKEKMIITGSTDCSVRLWTVG
jgi:WD40 repeat protein